MAIEQCLKLDNSVLDYGSLSELGRSYTKEFTIRNDCEQAVNVSGSVLVYGGEADASSLKANEWVNFVGGNNNFELGAKASKNVAMRVYLPEKADTGSYYATVKLKNTNSEQHDEEFGDIVDLTVRLNILSGDGGAFSGELEKNYAMPLSFGGKVASGAKIRNTGSVGYQVGYKLEKANAFGLESFETLVDETSELMVGSELEVNASEKTEGQFGVYKLRQTVNYVNGEGQRVESVLTQTVVNLPWVSVFIAGGCLFALIVLGIVAKAMKLNRKHKAKRKEDEEKLEEEIKEEKKEEKELLERSEEFEAAAKKAEKKAKK